MEENNKFKVGDEVKVIAEIDDSDEVLGMTGIVIGVEKYLCYIEFEEHSSWWVDNKALELIATTDEEKFWRKVMYSDVCSW